MRFPKNDGEEGNIMASKTTEKPKKVASTSSSKTAATIQFSAKLLRPAATEKNVTWSFLKLPQKASSKLPSRGMISVEGTINGRSFQATLEPDGQGGHWLKVEHKLCEA